MADDSELEIQTGTYRGVVVLQFRSPIEWLGLPPASARMLAEELLKHAETAEQQAREEEQDGQSGSG